ncbi:MAG: hypothetical protein CMM67_05475 [Rhodospirillaceae bacterium]|nr:hypothetical protein [Rhodospirillaceae bacterium]OUT79133.1 MAG: hypothetical protein CBB83_05660 [Rhodospirillaceae bacterium TMED23]|tara:strand:- start:583 stop:1506 length:924 start_codon:yes stop_codon:yes gene_type:complete
MQPTKVMILGFIYASLSTIIGGVTVVLTRLIITETDPLSLAFIRYGIGGIAVAIILYIVSSPPRIQSGDRIAIILLGMVMFAAFPYLMAKSLEDTTAARGGLLFATMPLVTIVIGAMFKVEKLNLTKILAVLCAMIGTSIAISENIDSTAPKALVGDFFMFLGMIAVSIFNVFSRPYLLKYGNLALMTYTLFFGVMTLFLLAVIFGAPFNGSLSFDIRGWSIVLVLAIPGGTLMFLLWGRALRSISPTQAAIATGLNPVTAILLGAWILYEPVTFRLIGGFLLILLGILISSRSKITPEPHVILAKD